MTKVSFLLGLIVVNVIMQVYNYFNKYERGVTMDDFELQERLDLMEYQIELLLEDTPYSRFVVQHKLTRNQADILDDVLRTIEKDNTSYNSDKFENEVSEKLGSDYNCGFCEQFARNCYKSGVYENTIFELYKNSNKSGEILMKDDESK